mgnify:CR=1 FL=1
MSIFIILFKKDFYWGWLKFYIWVELVVAVLDHNYDHNGKNEGEQRVRQTNFCREKRTTKALNIADFRVFNHPCYYYEPVGRGFESLSAHHEKAIAFCNRFFSYIRLTARGIAVQ